LLPRPQLFMDIHGQRESRPPALVRHGGLRERRQVASLPRSLTSAPRVTSRKLGNRRFLKPGCDQLFRAARNDNQACKDFRWGLREGAVDTVLTRSAERSAGKE